MSANARSRDEHKEHAIAALNEDGPQRAASKSRINSSCEISSPDIARGDQRSSKSGSIGKSAFRISLPLIIFRDKIADDAFCDRQKNVDWNVAF